MRILLLFVLLIPIVTCAQTAPVDDAAQGKKNRKIHIEGYAEVGYINELWIVSRNLPNATSSLTYSGTGGFIGGGLTSKTDAAHPLGFGISLDYMGYAMDPALNTNERAQTKFAYARFTPALYLRFKTKPSFNFHLCANANMLAPMHKNENTYFNLGLKACLGINAFVLDLGYYAGAGGNCPSSLITPDHWNEQMLVAGIICYPSRLENWGSLKAKLKEELKH